MEFSHLHSHTQFSLLDGAASIKNLYKKAAADGHKAIAITDHGNMFGVFNFVAEAAKHPGVKPIVGCEFYLVEDRHKRQFTRGEKDIRYHQLLLAKDEDGYKNLVKLCSLGYIEGLYGKYPRIDKELIDQYKEGLIATTCCLAAEVPRAIIQKGEAEAEKVFLWWLERFGEDYYIELQRHGIPEQEIVNQTLLKFAKKYNVKVICSNDSHYVDQADANAHDILLCINTGEKQSTPTNKDFNDDDTSSKGKRFAFYNDQFYFKTKDEMARVFHDVPESLDNTAEIVDKVTHLKLKKDILLPNFVIPQNFTSQDEYLRHLTYEGARKRYVEVTQEIEERLNFELFTIETMGFAGYFLIVQDFINKGREIGVFVGPGRGSAAGSAVAYCIGITNIDPIKYNLLFERFLNPDRKSMPDIDTDFDDEGRQKVIDYVVQQYGKDQVAQIVTYGTMAAKMSIKDVARVMDLPLQDSNFLAKMVPERPGIELNFILKASIDGDGGVKDKYSLAPEEVDTVKQLREILAGNDLRSKVLKEALKLEGSVRGTGIHAAGIIIAPKDLKEIIPVATAKDSDLLVTQFDGRVIEDAGVIKMDFLGLKTLTILRDALQMIKANHGIDIDLDSLPLDDAKTFALYQKAETNGTFQFESVGMQKHLRDLKPDKFDDLVAMNALFRPGPIQYIPSFIARKHGKEVIKYDLPEMEEYLSDTYGITVYQEQVMLLSQKLGGFTKGDADVLRKAMGKKQKEVLDKMKGKFIDGAAERGHDPKVLEKVWTDWEAFAQYAFNKSHSVCYALVAYQTGYLKAHYPAEYMAAVLSNNMSNIDKITFFMEECRRMGVSVLGPDVNESDIRFTVNKKGQIRFAMSAIKGIGEGVVTEIVNEREKGGPFTSIFDLTKRMSQRTLNVKALETLAYAGAFDGFEGIHRAQYFHPMRDNTTIIEKAVKFGQLYNQQKGMSTISLFGDTADSELQEPEIPAAEPWDEFYKLQKEKEVISIYLSGHPLDIFSYECKFFANAQLMDIIGTENVDASLAVLVTDVKKSVTNSGRPFARLNVEDKTGNMEISFYGDDYNKFLAFFEQGARLLISGGFKKAFKDSDRLNFRVLQMSFMQDLMEKKVKEIKLMTDIKAIDDEWVGSLFDIISLKKHKGNTPFKLLVYDEKIKEVTLNSRGVLLTPSKELFDGLSNLPFTRFKVELK